MKKRQAKNKKRSPRAKKTSAERQALPDYKPGGVTGQGFQPGESGNPGGRSRKFTSLLSDAVREALAEIDQTDPENKSTCASAIADGLVRGAVKAAKKCARYGRVSKELIHFLGEARDTTEGRPAQKVEVSGSLDTNPVDRVKELLARALERAAGSLGSGGTTGTSANP